MQIKGHTFTSELLYHPHNPVAAVQMNLAFPKASRNTNGTLIGTFDVVNLSLEFVELLG